MKIFTQPKVYLIARPSINWDGVKEFLGDKTWVWDDGVSIQPTDGELLPEFCGRMCYGSFGDRQGRKSNADYITNILSQGHGSVLEHANWTFLVTQASRGYTHQMIRHRAGFAYSQESTHFIDYDPVSGSLCVEPGLSDEQMDALEEAGLYAFRMYKSFYEDFRDDGAKKKVACSIARAILPSGIESKLAFTANARALRHFIELRLSPDNVREISDVAEQVLALMKVEAPSLFNDIQVVPEGNRNRSTTSFRKV